MKKRGGARPGAGRKKLDTVPLLVRPRRATADILRARARAERKTLGQIIDEVVGENGSKPLI